ncbi:MAG: hypothetical protein IJF68_04685 [Opitutales bacterium]|nr:hypothetical protein [Opitutales bacterium]
MADLTEELGKNNSRYSEIVSKYGIEREEALEKKLKFYWKNLYVLPAIICCISAIVVLFLGLANIVGYYNGLLALPIILFSVVALIVYWMQKRELEKKVRELKVHARVQKDMEQLESEILTSLENAIRNARKKNSGSRSRAHTCECNQER